MSPSKRRRVIAGNWKMFKTQADTRAFFSAFVPLASGAKHCDIVIAPPYTAISTAVECARGTNIAIGGQNVFWEKEGAFTGEISAQMLVGAGCRYVIIGHSERRQFFGDTDEAVAKKTKAAVAAGAVSIGFVGRGLAPQETGAPHTARPAAFTAGPGA